MEWPGNFGNLDSTEKDTYGFRSRNCPPVVEEVANFQNDLMMIKNIQFKYIKNDLQTKLKEDILNIQKCEKVLIPADKSRNIRKINNINRDAKKESNRFRPGR